jgi:hypothetical protein
MNKLQKCISIAKKDNIALLDADRAIAAAHNIVSKHYYASVNRFLGYHGDLVDKYAAVMFQCIKPELEGDALSEARIVIFIDAVFALSKTK